MGKISKVSLPKLEQFIDNWFSELLKDKTKIYPYIQQFGVNKQKEIIKRLASYPLTRDIEKSLIKRVKLYSNKIEITLYQEQVTEMLNAIYENREMSCLKPEELTKEDTYMESYHIGTIDNGAKVIVGQFTKPDKKQDQNLTKILALAFKWHQDILNGASTKQISVRDKVSYQYVVRLLNLSFLSPKIVRAILNGTQPADCTLKKLLAIKESDWYKQEQTLIK